MAAGCACAWRNFDVHGGIYWFPSPIIRINPFVHNLKTTSSERPNFFLYIYNIFSIDLPSPSLGGGCRVMES